MLRSRVRLVVLGSLVGFGVGVFLMASAADGYVSHRDYVSSLAARGSSVWVGGELVLVLLAAANAATLTALLGLASLAVVSVVVFRVRCPSGEARCDIGTALPPGDWVATAHGLSAGAWLLLTVVAMAVVAAGLRGRRRPWPRWLAVVSIPLALDALAFSGGADGGPHTGLWQRLWLASASVWLLLVAVAATRAPATLGERHLGRRFLVVVLALVTGAGVVTVRRAVHRVPPRWMSLAVAHDSASAPLRRNPPDP